MRIGIGFDAHRFISGRKLILGGVEIPFKFGLKGHSDADVLSHAVIDALFGAVAAGDIGSHFPDTDSKYKDISSLKLLAEVANELAAGDWRVANIDVTVVLEEPKLAPWRDAIRGNLADALRIDISLIGVKATTTEGLGFTGRGEGIAAHAVVLVEEQKMENRK